MKFNLRKYLTEKLQSDIIVKKLLNDSSGFFKFYKHNYYDIINSPFKDTIAYINNINHPFDKLCALSHILQNYIHIMFKESYFDGIQVRKTYTTTVTYKDMDLTDEKRIKAHQQYMKYYDMFLKCLKLNFTKPSTETLIPLLFNNGKYDEYAANENASHDISNISDDMFDIYTYAEIKNQKALYNKLCSEKFPIFWMSANNEILGYSYNLEIRLFGKNIVLQGLNVSKALLDILLYGDIDELKNSIPMIDMQLQDGTILKWPNTNNILSRIKTYADISANKHGIPVGKFLSKASKLYKTLNWGNNTKDYIIVFNGKDDHNVEAYKHINNALNNKNVVKEYVTNRSHWIKDIFGNTYPYRGAEKSLKFKSFMNNFFNDEYCFVAYERNYTRYKTLKTLKSSKTEIDNYINNEYNSLVQMSSVYNNFNKQLVNKIKASTGTEKVELMQLFGAFSYIFNDYLCIMSDILKSYDLYTTVYNKLTKQLIDNETELRVAATREYIDSIVENVKTKINEIKTKYIPAIEQIKDKIEEML